MKRARDRHDTEQPDWCDDCGVRHTPAQRQGILRRLGQDVTRSEARDRLGSLADHLWPLPEEKREVGTYGGDRKLLRDLRVVRGYPKRTQDGAQERLAKALKFVEQGTPATFAAYKAGTTKKRVLQALHAQGLVFRNAFRVELRGWVKAA